MPTIKSPLPVRAITRLSESQRQAVRLLSARIALESNRRYMSSYEDECFHELVEIRRLIRAKK